ncbi:endopeptidase La, partial [candidate division WWE3 bacterium]|nr:endopeptidase La [candidate division WWE3 bacterium]
MAIFKKNNLTQSTEENQPVSDAREHDGNFPETLPIIPIRDTVVYPFTVVPVYVDDNIGAKAAKRALEGDRYVAVFSLESNGEETPIDVNNLYSVGTVCLVHKVVPVSRQGTMVILQGVAKVELLDTSTSEVPWYGSVKAIKDGEQTNRRVKALAKSALTTAQNIISQTPYLPHQELQFALESLDDPLKLVYLISTVVGMKVEERQQVLELGDIKEKLEYLIKVLTREDELLQLGGKIQEDIRKDFSKSQREYFLRQKMKAIQKELGEDSDSAMDAEEYREKLEDRDLPEEVLEVVEREIERLSRMNTMAAEYQVIRTYLDWIFDVPWEIESKDKLDLKKSKKVLDDDHHDLKEPKERILEYLAVRKLQKSHTGSILCFVGPPGVGKTSLGKSVARAMGREFVRMSLGGVHDEAEIRGHRRTYIGAMPGRIIQGLKRAGTKNPVFMLDEIDKLSSDFRGDPSAALLEVLDPEQNDSFRDNYLDLDFDLSEVFFIATANTLDPIYPALRDRMEIIELSGYPEEEKVYIAKKYLWPKQRKEHGLTAKQVSLTDSAIKKIISNYTREAGVRGLERQLAKVCRKAAWEITSKEKKKVQVSSNNLEKYLGPQKVFPEVARRTSQPGVSTGLGVTSAGGELLFIEATAMPGSKKFQVTGQLGDVMKESAHAALSLVRARADKLGIDKDFFVKNDLHLHVPAGAVPKDGPSAGVAMTSAIASLAMGVKVRKDVAMTGEISLSGLVLPVGGIEQKVLAA